MASANVLLLVVQPRDVATGARTTIRLAGGGADFPYRYGSNDWLAGLEDVPAIITMLDYTGADFGTGAVPQALQLNWNASSTAALESLRGYYWAGAPFTLYLGPENAAGTMPAQLVKGTILQASITDSVLQLAMADPAADLQRPVLTASFAGTGGIEGPVDWEGRVKRRIWGYVFNVEGFAIDTANNVYSFSDPAFQLNEFTDVRDKGASAAAMTVLAWQGSVAATFTALQAAAAPAGGGVVCPSIGMVKWWTRPAGILAADLRGENYSGSFVTKAADIAQAIVAGRSGPGFDAGTVTAANALRTYNCGYMVDDLTTTIAQALDWLLGGLQLYWVLDAITQTIRIGAWDFGASAGSFTSSQVDRAAIMPPLQERKIGYQRNYREMAAGDLAAILTYDDGTPIESLKPGQSGATRNVTKGPWATATAYIVGDIVYLNGSSYSCILAHTSSGSNVPPNATYWQLFASVGPTGTGTPGADAITLEITRPAATLYAYADGTVTDFTNAYGKATLRQGTTDITSSATLSVTPSAGCDGQINNAGNTPIGSSPKGTYRPTALTADTATLTIFAVYAGVTYTKEVTLTRQIGGFQAVTTLPATGNTEGRTVSMGGNLYVYTSGAWKRSTSQPAGANLLLGAIPGTNPNRYLAQSWNPDGVPIENLGVGGNVSSPNFGGFPGAQWTLPDQGTFATHQTNGTHGTTGVYDLKFVRPVNLAGSIEDRWNVEELKTYEFSVYSACHRCEAEILIVWYDATGNTEITPATYSNKNSTSLTSNPPDGNSLSNYVRLVARGVAPAGAKVAKFILRKWNTTTGQGDSWAFWAHPIASEVPAGSADTLPWSAPAQGLFYAETIVANSITANQLATSGLITNTAQINSAVIIGAHIQDLAVDTLKIAGNAVTFMANAFGASGVGVTLGVDTEMAAITFTSTGAPCKIDFSLMVTIVSYNSANPDYVIVSVYRNGTQLYTTLPEIVNRTIPWAATIVDTPSAGSVTYSVKVFKYQGASSTGVSNRSISTLELKR